MGGAGRGGMFIIRMTSPHGFQALRPGEGETAARCPLVAAAGTARPGGGGGKPGTRLSRADLPAGAGGGWGGENPSQPPRSTPGGPRPRVLPSVPGAGGRAWGWAWGWGRGWEAGGLGPTETDWPHHSPHAVAQVLIIVVKQLKGVDLRVQGEQG